MTDPLFTRDFWLRTFTQAVHASAGSAVGVLTAKGLGTIPSLPWDGLANAAVFGGVLSILLSISSQAVPNTTPASFLPKNKT